MDFLFKNLCHNCDHRPVPNQNAVDRHDVPNLRTGQSHWTVKKTTTLMATINFHARKNKKTTHQAFTCHHKDSRVHS